MTDYKTLRGQKVKAVASDPSPLYEGQVWYNTGDSKLRVVGVSTPTWTESGDVNTARGLYGGGCGINTASICFGGIPKTGATEEYNGTAWSEQNDFGTASYGTGGTGTQTAALAVGGQVPSVTAKTEEYNGTAWSEQNDLATARANPVVSGVQTAALATTGAGGTDTCEEYNGSAWSEIAEANTVRANAGGCGTTEASLIAGGSTSPYDQSEEFNGTAWSEGNNLNTGRVHNMGFFGIQTLAFMAGGGNPGATNVVALTEEYNGTSWAETTDLNTARNDQAGGGTSTDGISISGGAGPFIGNVEEFSVGGETTLDITAS